MHHEAGDGKVVLNSWGDVIFNGSLDVLSHALREGGTHVASCARYNMNPLCTGSHHISLASWQHLASGHVLFQMICSDPWREGPGPTPLAVLA